MDTALIVEDDADQAEVLARLLRHHNLQSVVADCGEAGLRAAREVAPDIVLLDLMLPDIDGFQVCRRLRAERATMRTPVVMVTALEGPAHRAKGFRVGANAYLTKPFGAEDLFRAIDLALAWRDDLERHGARGEIQVELNSQTEFLQEVNDFLAGLSLGTPLAAEQVMHLRQAIMELGQNAIEWGHRHDSDELVTIVYRVFPDRVEITIRDNGPGFDRSQLPHAADPDDPVAHLDVREKLGLRDGGFGLLICRGLTDELTYNDRGNEVRFAIRFRPDPAEAPATPLGADEGPNRA